MFSIKSIDRIDTIAISVILISYIVGSFYNNDKMWNCIYVLTINIIVTLIGLRLHSLIWNDSSDNQFDINTAVQNIILVSIINTALFLSSLIIRWLSNISDHYATTVKRTENMISSNIVKNINEIRGTMKSISQENNSSIKSLRDELLAKTDQNQELIDNFKMEQSEFCDTMRNDIQELTDRLTTTINMVTRLKSKK